MKKIPSKEQQQDSVRQLLKGVIFSDIHFLTTLKGDQRKKFCKWCFELHHNEFLKPLLNDIVAAQINFSVRIASNYDEVTFGRATVNGVELVSETIEKYATVWEKEYAPEKPMFDETKTFGTVDESEE